jgi:CBS domain-containing protein
MASLVRRRKHSPREVLGSIAVKDVMKAPVTVTFDASIYDAAQTLVDQSIECLLVLKEQKLVGLVTRTDLLRELAKR